MVNYSILVLIELEQSEWIVLDCCTTDSLIPLLVTKLELLHSELLDRTLCIVLFVSSTSAPSCWRGLYCQLMTGPVSEKLDSDNELEDWKKLEEWLCCILLLGCCMMLLRFCWFPIMVDWLLLCCRVFVLMDECMDWMLHKLLEGWSRWAYPGLSIDWLPSDFMLLEDLSCW